MINIQEQRNRKKWVDMGDSTFFLRKSGMVCFIDFLILLLLSMIDCVYSNRDEMGEEYG